MTEAQFQQAVTDLCDLLRLKWHHETDSRRTKAGFLDLVICGPNGLIFAELKSAKGRVTPEQREWIEALHAAGQAAYVWRPDDITEISRLLHHLAGRRVR